MKFIKKMNKKKKLMFFGGIALVIGFIIAIVLIVSGNVQSNSIEGLTKAYMKKYQRLDKINYTLTLTLNTANICIHKR